MFPKCIGIVGNNHSCKVFQDPEYHVPRWRAAAVDDKYAGTSDFCIPTAVNSRRVALEVDLPVAFMLIKLQYHSQLVNSTPKHLSFPMHFLTCGELPATFLLCTDNFSIA